MKISVITAVYNRVGTVAESISSVQEQTYSDIEHVIQDGGSYDGTFEVVSSMAIRSTKLISERDEGLYDAINKGIQRATGDVIGLLHSDDVLSGDRVLAKVADCFADPQIDGVYGDLQYVAARNPDHVVRHWRAGQFNVKSLERGWMPPHPTLYLRRDVFERYGLYDTSFGISADYDAMLRYLTQGQIALTYIPEVLVKMRLGGESNRSLERILSKSREDLRALRKNRVGGIRTLAAKNLSKLGQFFVKEDRSR